MIRVQESCVPPRQARRGPRDPSLEFIQLAPGILEEVGIKNGSAARLCAAKKSYATLDQIRSAIAEHPGVKSVNLSNMRIPPTIIAMIPESVARENVLIPIGEENGMLQIVMSNPSDYDTIAKLQFILARDILLAVAPEEQIVAAINRHYGQS